MANNKQPDTSNESSLDEKSLLREANDGATSEDAAAEQPHVVFCSDASYHPVMCLLIAFGPLAILASILLVWRDDSSTEQEKRVALRASLWSTLALVLVFVLVLPRRFEVASDASVNVVTFVKIKWNFQNITAAYDNQTIFSEWWRPKIKFACDFDKRVVVRRKNGAWDLLVSPKDPAGFVEAVYKVVAGEKKGSES
jgi:hypothetical protein